jgi:hypothetical protein
MMVPTTIAVACVRPSERSSAPGCAMRGGAYANTGTESRPGNPPRRLPPDRQRDTAHATESDVQRDAGPVETPQSICVERFGVHGQRGVSGTVSAPAWIRAVGDDRTGWRSAPSAMTAPRDAPPLPRPQDILNRSVPADPETPAGRLYIGHRC